MYNTIPYINEDGIEETLYLNNSENYIELIKDIHFHLMVYRDGIIDEHDLIQAIEEVLYINLDKL
tara:strand:+ start:173 stop:367 length:195 start_codon:yes stop_codon:yes gene_type:complete